MQGYENIRNTWDWWFHEFFFFFLFFFHPFPEHDIRRSLQATYAKLLRAGRPCSINRSIQDIVPWRIMRLQGDWLGRSIVSIGYRLCSYLSREIYHSKRWIHFWLTYDRYEISYKQIRCWILRPPSGTFWVKDVQPTGLELLRNGIVTRRLWGKKGRKIWIFFFSHTAVTTFRRFNGKLIIDFSVR